MDVKIRQVFDSEEAAVVSKEYTEGTMALMGGMLGSPALQEVASGMTATVEGNAATFDLSINVAQMEAILDFLFSFAAMGSPTP